MATQGNLFGAPTTISTEHARPFEWSTGAGDWHGCSADQLRAALERTSAYPDADFAEVRDGAVIVRGSVTYRRRPSDAERADSLRQIRLI